MNHLSLNIASETGNIRKAENFIEDIIEEFRIPEKLHVRIRLSVIEAVTNSIVFGNKNNPAKNVKLHASLKNRKIVITVEDERKEIKLYISRDFTNMDEVLEKTGRGMYLMTHLPDEMIFTHNGTKVTMTYFLNDPA